MDSNDNFTFTEDGFNSSATFTDDLFNNSATSLVDVDSGPISFGMQLLIGGCLSIIIALAISGNVLVCVAVLTDRNLRKIGNLYIVSLSFADLTLACLVMTFALTNDLLEYWPFGRQFCDTWVAFDVMCSTASILNLCAISLDRYIHIKDPLRYGRWMTKRIVLGSIAAIWVMALLVSFLPISLGLHRPKNSAVDGQAVQQDGERPQCALDLTPLYAVVSSCISFYAPCLVMLAIYSRLYLYAKKHVRNIRALQKPVTFGTIDGVAPPPACNRCHVVSESKAATTVGIIVGVFLVCYVPFFCVNIVASFCKTCVPRLVFQTLTWFGYSNSSFNPIIYSIFNAEFREAFARILRRMRRSCLSVCQASDGVGSRSRRSTMLTNASVRAKPTVLTAQGVRLVGGATVPRGGEAESSTALPQPAARAAAADPQMAAAAVSGDMADSEVDRFIDDTTRSEQDAEGAAYIERVTAMSHGGVTPPTTCTYESATRGRRRSTCARESCELMI